MKKMKKVIIQIVTLLVTFTVVTMNSAIVCAADEPITPVVDQVSAEYEVPSEESTVDGGGSTPLTVYQAAMLAVKAGIVWQDNDGFFHLVIEPSIGEPPIKEEEPTAPTEAPTEVVSDEAKTVAAIDDAPPIEENISNNDVPADEMTAEEMTAAEHTDIGSAIWRDASGWFHTSDGYNWWEPLYPEAEDDVLLDVADPIPPVVDPDKVCDCCEGVDLAQLPYMGWMDNDGVWHLREIGVYPFVVATEKQ